MNAESRKACLENWPDAEPDTFNPMCCRFPKSCSIPPPQDNEAGLVAPDPPTFEELRKMEANYKLRTFGGEPTTFHHGHDGYPVDNAEIVKAAKEGRKAYTPTDPTSIDQRPYRAFAVKRGKNSE